MIISNELKKFIKMFLLIILILILGFAGYLFIGSAKQAQNITWGVNFSQKHTQFFGLDWQKTYLALLDDLGVKNFKIASHWDLLETEEGKYDFQDLDWQINETAKREGRIVLVVGMKTPRWPECHIPDWAKTLNKEEQQEKILKLLEKLVLRYKDSPAISAWQVENEPFFPFGECPWADKEFVKKEVALVKSLDTQNRQIIISDSGEGPFWFKAASIGDVVGITMYKRVWIHQIKLYFTYPFPPVFYHRKAEIIRKFFNKEVICVELQAEPWGPKLLYDISLEEQEKTMNLKQFKYNIDFAKRSGFNEFYLWGAEWWYWMKEKQQRPEIWDEAKKLF